jgi:NTP pyrophosphatase (non-canonical NTP hydrolase)
VTLLIKGSDAVDKWLDEFLWELINAEKKHPGWPDDVVHASAILAEESGELTQAALDYHYSNGAAERLAEEAVQCGAMALRFLLHLETYKRRQK